jgi:hypothetical protein
MDKGLDILVVINYTTLAMEGRIIWPIDHAQ